MGGCFVPGCVTGHTKANVAHLFCPKKENGTQWTTILRKLRTDTVFDPNNRNHRICSLHFEEKHLIKNDRFTINEEVVLLPRKNWTLTDDALSTKFPTIPKSIQPHIPNKRRKLLRTLQPVNRQINRNEESELKQSINPVPDLKLWWQMNNKVFNYWKFYEEDGTQTIYTLKMAPEQLILSNSIIYKANENGIEFCKSFITGKRVPSHFLAPHVTTTTVDFTGLVEAVSALNACNGIDGFSDIISIKGGTKKGNVWYSKQCIEVGESLVCTSCKILHQSLSRKLYRKMSDCKGNPKTHYNLISRKLKYYTARTQKLTHERKSLRSELVEIKSNLHTISIVNVERKLKEVNLPSPMTSNVIHCLQIVQRKSAKGMRYSSDWLLESLLLKIKSPAAYRHLRDAKILPLPHPHTLCKLISSQRCEFGFNESSLLAIKREYNGKERRDRQGILVFDEIQLRETLDYNRHTHRFDGYVDYGDYTEDCVRDPESKKLANHALVIMYRPYNGNWMQPIAAFATKNAASGTALHKVVLEAVVKLEQIGAEVLSIVCDGSKPNKSFWKMCGVGLFEGKIVNKVNHPCDESRWLYFCSDFPHLFKCVRNHILKYGCVEAFFGEINFSYYEELLKEDSRRACGLRKCPKLTRSHISPNNFEKMVVPLATQLFSRSVATGLKFYREMGVKGFEYSDATESFTQCLNDLFDAFNCRFPSDSVSIDCKHYKTLKSFELNLEHYIEYMCGSEVNLATIPFASKETLIGLKITVTSTLEITDFLIRELGFGYVLTGKITQDCLEKFFGLVRGAGGREDHPTITNFIQLFRLLSLYNPIKRMLRGNVRSAEDVDVLVPYENALRNASKIESVRKKEKMQFVEELLVSKLHSLETSGEVYESEFQDSSDTLKNNIVYHLAGFLCFKASKLLKCMHCKDSLSCTSAEIEGVSVMTDILDYRGLHHPTKEFFHSVQALERAVCEAIRVHTSCGDILIDCINKLSFKSYPNLGCQEEGHLEDVVISLFPYYITMRLHFFAKAKRNEMGHGKATKNKRKESKLKS